MHTIADWRPCEYYTTELMTNGRYHVCHRIILEEGDGGTRVSYFLEPLQGCTHLLKLIVKLMSLQDQDRDRAYLSVLPDHTAGNGRCRSGGGKTHTDTNQQRARHMHPKDNEHANRYITARKGTAE